MRPSGQAMVAITLWLSAAVAVAQPREVTRVVVLAPSAGTERALRSELDVGLAAAHVETISLAATAADPVLAACRAAACAGEVVAATRATFAVLVSVSADVPGGTRNLDLQLIAADGRRSRVALAVEDGIGPSVREAFERARLSLSLGADSLLRMRTRPVGALLSVDGSVAGVAPSDLRVKPGSHEILATLAGFTARQATVVTQAGQLVPVELELPRLAAGSAEDHVAPGAPGAAVLDYVLGGVLVVAGLSAVVIPLETLARDGACSGRRDALGRCSDTVYFGPQSAVLLAAGVVSLAAGFYLLCATPFSVDAAVSSDGARLAVRGRM